MQTEKRPSSQGATWGLAILLGIVGVSIQQSVGGFVIGAAFGGLLAQIFYLRSRSEALDRQLQDLKQRRRSRSRARAQPQRRRRNLRRRPRLRQSRDRSRASRPCCRNRCPRRGPRRRRQRRTSFDRAVAAFLAWLKRGNPLARAGIVILFFGAAFLAKYAADNSMLPIELRFIGLALGAFGLLIVGWRLREKRAVYAQLLQGGGIAGLYLTVFAATRLFKLLPSHSPSCCWQSLRSLAQYWRLRRTR